MKLLRRVQNVADFSCGTVTTIGNFDGVHLGHQALLATLREQAQRLKLPMVVMLFDPQPGEFFYGETSPARLSNLREKARLLKHCGVDYIYCLKFDKNLALMSAHEFANHYLFHVLKSKYLLVGRDFRFGRQRLGDIALLNQLGLIHACVVAEFNDFFMHGQRVSSTYIRKLLRKGELVEAALLLGRFYSISGRVVAGDGIGRQWGLPTVNLTLSDNAFALKGVFCVSVKRFNKPDLLGVANLGCRPTVKGIKNRLEIHLFDFNESCYGECLQVNFLNKLRDEIKFSSVDALISQIHRDIAMAQLFFGKKKQVEIG